MKLDKPVLMKFRNYLGEVVVYAMIQNDYKTVHAGFACCNPMDVRLPKQEKVRKGVIIAEGRFNSDRQQKIELEAELSAVPEDAQMMSLRIATLKYMGQFEAHRLGLREYNGKNEKEAFRKWFVPFLERAMLEETAQAYKLTEEMKRATNG